MGSILCFLFTFLLTIQSLAACPLSQVTEARLLAAIGELGKIEVGTPFEESPKSSFVDYQVSPDKLFLVASDSYGGLHIFKKKNVERSDFTYQGRRQVTEVDHSYQRSAGHDQSDTFVGGGRIESLAWLPAGRLALHTQGKILVYDFTQKSVTFSQEIGAAHSNKLFKKMVAMESQGSGDLLVLWTAKRLPIAVRLGMPGLRELRVPGRGANGRQKNPVLTGSFVPDSEGLHPAVAFLSISGEITFFEWTGSRLARSRSLDFRRILGSGEALARRHPRLAFVRRAEGQNVFEVRFARGEAVLLQIADDQLFP